MPDKFITGIYIATAIVPITIAFASANMDELKITYYPEIALWSIVLIIECLAILIAWNNDEKWLFGCLLVRLILHMLYATVSIYKFYRFSNEIWRDVGQFIFYFIEVISLIFILNDE